MRKTEDTHLTVCCDAPVKYYALSTKGQCSECGEDMPVTYRKERDVKDFVGFLNDKIEEENK